MGPKPINTILKPHFDNIVSASQKEAAIEFAKFKTIIDNLNHFSKSKSTIDELSKIENKIQANDHPYYVKNHSSDDWLLTQFANRSILLNVDESDALKETVFLGEYRSLLWELQRELKESIPVYTYHDFLNGSDCRYFFELDHFYNITEQDYYCIREWQAENVREVVLHDYSLLIKEIQRHCTTLLQPLEFLKTENIKIDDLMKSSTADELLNKMSRLTAFSRVQIPRFNKDRLGKTHRIFTSETTQLDYSEICPRSLNPSLLSIKFSANEFAGNEITIFQTINKYQDWIERVINGQPVQNPEKDPEWDLLLEEIQTASEAAIEKEESAIYDHTEKFNDQPAELKKYLIDRFNFYRSKFNAYEEKYFFHLFTDDKKQLLRRMFITNAFFSNDLTGLSTALLNALTIHGCLWSIVGIYGHEFDTHKMDLPTGPASSHIEILSLLNQMILDKESYEVMNQSMDDFGTQFEQYMLPFELHILNQVDVWRKQFFKAMNRLEEILDNADQTNKIHYLQSRIKDLRHRELRLREYYTEFDKTLDKEGTYLNLFKEFLIIEAAYVRETSDLQISNSISASTDLPIIKQHPRNLEDLVDRRKKDFVFQILEDLSVTKSKVSILSERKKGALRGIIEALRENNILPNISLELLCKITAAEIQMGLKSKLDYSSISDEFKKKAVKYISANYTA